MQEVAVPVSNHSMGRRHLARLAHLPRPQLRSDVADAAVAAWKERQMSPASDPLDPLELALLMEASEDQSDLDRDDLPPADGVPEDRDPDGEEP